MKILFVSQNFPYPPYKDGARLKAYNLIKHLSDQNDIYLITFAEQHEFIGLREIEKYCVRVDTVDWEVPRGNVCTKSTSLLRKIINPLRFTSQRMRSKIKEVVQEWRPDLAHVDLPMMSQYADCLEQTKKILNSVDAISLFAYKNLFSSKNIINKAMWFWLYRQRRYVESYFYPYYDACTVVSDEDRRFLKKYCPDLPIEVIPNGVDIEYFSPEKIKEDDVSRRPSIGLFGGMDFKPNVDAALHFTFEIYPLIKTEVPDVKFYIVGREPPKSVWSLTKQEGVIVTGEVTDMREYYEKTSVVVSPIYLGSGIKNTVLQAMSMAKPIVATPQAVRAIAVEDGIHLMVAEDASEFALKVTCLLRNESLREKLGQNARNLVVSKYSWQSHAEAFQRLYEGVLNESTCSI